MTPGRMDRSVWCCVQTVHLGWVRFLSVISAQARACSVAEEGDGVPCDIRFHEVALHCSQVKLSNQPDGYEFSIKTPVTPSRWDDYDTVIADCPFLLFSAHVLLFLHLCMQQSGQC